MDIPPWIGPATAVGATFALLAVKHFAVLRWIGGVVRWLYRKAMAAAHAVIDLFRHRARLDAHDRSIAALQQALETAKGPPSVRHQGIRWALSDIDDQPVPHCDVCFQKTGHLYELDVHPNINDRTGQNLVVRCPNTTAKCAMIFPEKADLNSWKIQVVRRLSISQPARPDPPVPPRQ